MKDRDTKGNPFYFSAILFSLAVSIGLHGETVYMRNGDTYEGEVIAQDRKMVRLRMEGRVVTLDKQDIKRIHYDSRVGETPKQDTLLDETGEAGGVRLQEQQKEQERLKQEQKRAEEDRQKQLEKERGIERDRQERIKQEQQRLENAERERAERQRRIAGMQTETVLWDRMHRDAAIKDPVTSPATATVTAPPVGPAAGPTVPRSEVMWRSALLPGWGQFHQGRTIRGSAYMGGFLLAGGAVVYYSRELSRDTRLYQSSVQNLFNSMFVFNAQARSFSTGIPTTAAVGLSSLELYYLSQRNNARAAQVGSAYRFAAATAIFAGIYLWNFGDAYWGTRTRTALGFMPYADGGGLVLVYRF